MRSRNRAPTIAGCAGLVVVLAAGAVVGGLLLLRGPAVPPAGPPWDKRATISQADLDEVAPIELWARMFKTQAMQEVVHLTQVQTRTERPKGELRYALTIVDASFDYRTKKLAAQTFFRRTLSGPDVTRCVEGVQYGYQPDDPPWKRQGTESLCDPGRSASVWADGVGTGGLTEDQADAFIGYLLSLEGGDGRKVITAQEAKLTDRHGKQYIRLVVRVWMYEDGNDLGMFNFRLAFEETGLELDAHPYGVSRVKSGMLAIYYVDPATMLPAYAEFHPLPNPAPRDEYEHRRVEYAFGGALPELTLDSPRTPPELSWPPEEL